MITGDSLVKWIKERLIPDTTLDVAVSVNNNEYQLLLPNITRSVSQIEDVVNTTTAEESWRLLARLLDGAESQPPKRRKSVYAQIERNSSLSPLVRRCFGNRCQVENCCFTGNTNRNLDEFIAEVHHLEHLSRGGTHSAYNLCVLCANHHRLFHRDKSARITNFFGDNVAISSVEGVVTIHRDLSRLNSI